MKSQYVLQGKGKFVLSTITEQEIELIRVWKNDNKKSFFYQKEISSTEQTKWFESYSERDNDYIFMVEEHGETDTKIGCLGFRLQDDKKAIDLYNIIRGRESVYGTTMIQAMHVLIQHLTETYPDYEIKCDVLLDNPAIGWYEKCGFVKKEYHTNYVVMVWDTGNRHHEGGDCI